MTAVSNDVIHCCQTSVNFILDIVFFLHCFKTSRGFISTVTVIDFLLLSNYLSFGSVLFIQSLSTLFMVADTGFWNILALLL